MFSLGVMGYELLTGKRLFDGDTDLKTLDQVRHGRIPTVTAEHPHLPTPVALLIEACLSRNPGERPSADNVRRDLLGQLHELTLGEGITSQDLGKYVKESLGDEPDGMNLSDALNLQLGTPSSDAGQTATFLRDAEEWKPSSPSDVFERSSSWPSTEITAQQTANVKSLTSMVRILVAAVVILLVVNVIFFFGSGERTNLPPVEPTPPGMSNAAPSPENGVTQEAPMQEPPKPTEQPTAVEPTPIVDTVKPSSPAAQGEDRRQQIEEPEREKRVGMDDILKFKTVKLTSPSTAKVFANGTLLGTGPQEVKFKEDAEMKVSVREKGYKTSYTTLSATSRSRVTVTLSRKVQAQFVFVSFQRTPKSFSMARKSNWVEPM